MFTSIRKDFGGIWVGYNREELLRRLDYVLGQLDLGLEHLRQHEPSLNEDEIREMKRQYGQLKEVLLEVDREANDRLIRESLRWLTIAFGLLTPVDRLWVPHVQVCDSPPMIVIACPDHSIFLPRPTTPRRLSQPRYYIANPPRFGHISSSFLL